MALSRVLSQSNFLSNRMSSPACPSVDEILERMDSVPLTRCNIDHFREMGHLMTYQEPSFEGIGLKASSLMSRSTNIPLLSDTVFVHATLIDRAIQLIQSDGEFSKRYFSTSLFDPNNPNGGCFPARVGLILDIPTESVITAYHRDLNTCRRSSSRHPSFLAENYQIRAMKNYIQSLLLNSGCQVADADIRGNNQPALESKLGLNSIRKLIDVYRDRMHKMTEREHREAYKALFQREGIGIASELEHVYEVAKVHLEHMLYLHNTNHFHPRPQYLLGEFEGRERLLRKIDDFDDKIQRTTDIRNPIHDSLWNEVVVHSPASCREFGLKPPTITGVLKMVDEDLDFTYIERGHCERVFNIALERGLPIFHHPKAVHTAWKCREYS